MSDLEPNITTKTRVSPLWIVPAIAALIGAWMLVNAWMTEGPTITIEFATAEGLHEGKTHVKMLNVDVGLVEEVTLKPDVSGVTLKVKLDKEVEPLLRDDTRFWVVRARVGAGGVSGIGTILSGAYIELDPGTGDEGARRFVGLEVPPITPAGAPGKHFVLTSESAALSIGDPVLFRDFKVGRVESMTFDAETELAEYAIFVQAPYDRLIHRTTRFWNVSGVSVDMTAEGFHMRMGALDTLLLGGVAFTSPPGMPRGSDAIEGDTFRLYESYNDILENPFSVGTYYVVAFDGSVAGLVPGAPVTYKGIEMGRVERLLIAELTASRRDVAGAGNSGSAIPALIYLEPGRIELPDEPESVDVLRGAIGAGVRSGLRATLRSGNLITGRQVVALDFYPQAEPEAMGRFGDYDVIPTIETGIGRIEDQVGQLLVKLNELPLEQTVSGLNDTIGEMRVVLTNLNEGVSSVNGLLSSQGAQRLPEEIAGTLEEIRLVLDGFDQNSSMYQDLNASLSSLDRTLENLDRMSQALAAKPNSVIFSSKQAPDPVPEARP